MKTVLFAVPTYPPHVGSGSATYYPALLERLAKEGHDVTLVAPYHRQAPVVEEVDDYSVYRVFWRVDSLPEPIYSVVSRSSLFELGLRTLFETLPTLIASLLVVLYDDSDVFHVHATSLLSPAAIATAYLTAVGLVLDCRDENFPHWLVKIAPRSAYLSCARNITDALRDAGIDAEYITEIPVVNPEYISEYATPAPRKPTDGRLEVIFIGRLIEDKGIHLLVEALQRLRSRDVDVELTVVGDGHARPELERTIERHRLKDAVSLAGELDHRETLSMLSKADVLVLPSNSEGLPRVVLEAMECGVAVVSTNVGDVETVLTDEETGLLIDRTVESIVHALERLTRNPEQRAEMVANAKRRMENRNWETVLEDVEAAYECA